MKNERKEELQLVRDFEALIDKYSYGQITPWAFIGIIQFKLSSFIKQILEHPEMLGDD